MATAPAPDKENVVPEPTPAALAEYVGFTAGQNAADRLEDYEIGKLLGKGTYGAVRLARHKPTGSAYAIKTVTKALLARKKKEQMVELECGILSKIKHPNIIALREWMEHDDKYHLVFELATGGELLERIDDLPSFTEGGAAAVVATMLNALAFCHDHGIIHRDIKVENLVWKHKGPNAPLCLVDFGISRVIDVSEGAAPELLKSICGSLAYTAPETLKRVGYNVGVDIWATGCIAYILLSGGRHPFLDTRENAGIAALCNRIIKADFNFNPPTFKSVSDLGKDFIRRLLDPNPATRPSAHEALNHEFIRKYCPPGYLDYLVEVNEEAEFMGISNRDRKASQQELPLLQTVVEDDETTVTPPSPISPTLPEPVLRKAGDTLNRPRALSNTLERGAHARRGSQLLIRRGSLLPNALSTGQLVTVDIAPDILQDSAVQPSAAQPDLFLADKVVDAPERVVATEAKERWGKVLKLVSSVKVWEGLVGSRNDNEE